MVLGRIVVVVASINVLNEITYKTKRKKWQQKIFNSRLTDCAITIDGWMDGWKVGLLVGWMDCNNY